MGLLNPPPKPRAVIRSGRGQPKTGQLRNLCIFQEALCGETSEVVEFLGDEAISSLGGEACNCRECSSDDVRESVIVHSQTRHDETLILCWARVWKLSPCSESGEVLKPSSGMASGILEAQLGRNGWDVVVILFAACS